MCEVGPGQNAVSALSMYVSFFLHTSEGLVLLPKGVSFLVLVEALQDPRGLELPIRRPCVMRA